MVNTDNIKIKQLIFNKYGFFIENKNIEEAFSRICIFNKERFLKEMNLHKFDLKDLFLNNKAIKLFEEYFDSYKNHDFLNVLQNSFSENIFVKERTNLKELLIDLLEEQSCVIFEYKENYSIKENINAVIYRKFKKFKYIKELIEFNKEFVIKDQYISSLYNLFHKNNIFYLEENNIEYFEYKFIENEKYITDKIKESICILFFENKLDFLFSIGKILIEENLTKEQYKEYLIKGDFNNLFLFCNKLFKNENLNRLFYDNKKDYLKNIKK